jgi:hypothetical protein
MDFTRASPSPRYAELLALYREMHLRGDPSAGLPADMTFNGISLRPHVNRIRALIRETGARSLLDYGCGKGFGYQGATVALANNAGQATLQQFWELQEVALYDPAVAEFDALPERNFDAVISTDVLEHCPEEDIDWILADIFAHARLFVFCTVALFPASKKLPSGDNAHVTLKDAAWWRDKFDAAKGDRALRYILTLMPAPDRSEEIQR